LSPAPLPSPAPPPTLATVAEMVRWSDDARARHQRIALVPTMGALHTGHVSLLEAARRRADRLVLSIFVNPTQFGPKEDFARYPRDLRADLELAAPAGVDLVFAPTVAEMYPAGHQTTVRVEQLERALCGPFRPDHFAGVATVVCKLFNIVRPDLAFFGEKDFQQLAVIRRMVLDLDLRVEVVGAATVREADGLALSSRNRYLSAEDRARARGLSAGLFAARARFAAGERRAAELLSVAQAIIHPAVDRLDYLELDDAESLQPVLGAITRPAVLAVAGFVGTTRLIDNVRLDP
jgi:pantoate--beta-alanine ligase